MTYALVRLALVAGALQVLLRRRLPCILRVLAPQRFGLPALFAELQRIETDLAYRVRFFAGLNAALAERNAERVAELDALRTALNQLRNPVSPATADKGFAEPDTRIRQRTTSWDAETTTVLHEADRAAELRVWADSVAAQDRDIRRPMPCTSPAHRTTTLGRRAS